MFVHSVHLFYLIVLYVVVRLEFSTNEFKFVEFNKWIYGIKNQNVHKRDILLRHTHKTRNTTTLQVLFQIIKQWNGKWWDINETPKSWIAFEVWGWGSRVINGRSSLRSSCAFAAVVVSVSELEAVGAQMTFRRALLAEEGQREDWRSLVRLSSALWTTSGMWSGSMRGLISRLLNAVSLDHSAR